MKKLILYLLLFPGISIAQTGITFKVEELTKPKNLLEEKNYEDILKSRILDAAYGKDGSNNHHPSSFEFGIVAKSKQENKLIDFGNNPFFSGLHRAYADHRPFVLSPDMVWLLITQGFARHVNQNAEELRKDFVDFDGKQSLVVNDNSISLTNPDANWESVFAEWNAGIAGNIKNSLVQTLTTDFSTTTPISKAVSQVTIMETVKSYFEFSVLRIVCGIPEITLEGTPEDWQKILSKAQGLKKYKLDWWINELEPLLHEFVNTSNGKPDAIFWQKIFKTHGKGGCGPPLIVDGWAVKFFPYDKDGKRLNLKQLHLSGSQLPTEMVRVDFKHIEVSPTSSKETPLEVFAGFTGLSQNPNTFALKPEVGWMVRKRSDEAAILAREISGAAGVDIIKLRIKEIPEAIFRLRKIPEFNLIFIDSIKIPERIKEVEISRLSLKGKISAQEIDRIIKIFPGKTININGSVYNSRLQLMRASKEVDKYKPLRDIKIKDVWTEGQEGSGYSICNLDGFIVSGFGAEVIKEWNAKHPGSQVFPMTTSAYTKNGVIQSRNTFCLVSDGDETLNSYLVKKGLVSAKSMELRSPLKDRPEDERKMFRGRSEDYTEEFKILIDDKSYQRYLKQIYAAEQYAKTNKLGIHAEPTSK